MERDEDIVLLQALFASPLPVSTAMRRTLDFCRSKYRIEGVERLYELPFEKETEELKVWAKRILQFQPPPHSIQAYYFGLFDSVGKDRNLRPCLYVSGSELFDEREEQQEWACTPSYLPEGRYVISEVLTALDEKAKRTAEHADELSFLLQISFAGFAISHVMQDLPKEFTLGSRLSRGLAIGFDEGDLFLLPAIKR